MKREEKNFREMLNTSFESATPEMRADVKGAEIVTTSTADITPTPRRRSPLRSRRAMHMLIAACMCLVVLIGAYVVNITAAPPSLPLDYTGYISLKVNPAFSITVGADGTVERVVADNYDGELILDAIADEQVNLALHYDKTIKVLLSYAQLLGYFSSSDGIKIDIYNCVADTAVRREMQTHIESSISTVSKEAPPVTIGEMTRENLLEIAREFQANIAAEISDSELFDIIKNKKGYRDTRSDRNDADVVSSEELYDLSLLYYSVSALGEMKGYFDVAEIYMTLHQSSPEEFFGGVGIVPYTMQLRVDRLLAWTGDTRTLTAETYEELRAYADATFEGADYEALESLLSAYRRGETLAEGNLDVKAHLLENESIAACYALLKVKYPYENIKSIMSGMMALERSYREAVAMSGNLDWLYGDHEEETDKEDKEEVEDDRIDNRPIRPPNEKKEKN